MTTKTAMNPNMPKACETWFELYKIYNAMSQTALKLFAHPDATDEQIVHVARVLGATRTKLLDSRRKITQHKDYYGLSYRYNLERKAL